MFGAFSPVTGDSFLLDLPYCNTDMFQLFLKNFSIENKNELKVIFLDNGAFHKAKRLQVPENIILVFLPPYSPELNGAEKVWWVLKREINLCSFDTLEKLENKLIKLIQKNINKDRVISLTSYEVFLSAYRTIINI